MASGWKNTKRAHVVANCEYEQMIDLRRRNPKAYAEFKRVPDYSVHERSCYHRPERTCNSKCLFWDFCSKKTGRKKCTGRKGQ